jgi:hypothetical protein
MQCSPSAGDAPVVYVAAGTNEAFAWDAVNGFIKEVLKLNNGGAPQILPDVLGAPAQDLFDGAGDPLARGRQLGATELRTLTARRPGFRALLSGVGHQLLTGGTDCAVRCWDMVSLQQSYMVVTAPPTPHDRNDVPQWEYTTRMVGQVTVAEERRMFTVPSKSNNQAEVQKKQLLAAHWWDRTSALCHQQTIVDLAHIEGHAEPLLASASLDGGIKIWRWKWKIAWLYEEVDFPEWYVFLSFSVNGKNMKGFLRAGRSSVAHIHLRSLILSKVDVIATQGRIHGQRREYPTLLCHANNQKIQQCRLSADQPIPAVGATELPTQGDSAVAGIDPIDYINKQLQDILKPPSTEDYLAVSAVVITCPRPKPWLCLLVPVFSLCKASTLTGVSGYPK